MRIVYGDLESVHGCIFQQSLAAFSRGECVWRLVSTLFASCVELTFQKFNKFNNFNNLN